jgi:hypothetical protein
MAHPLPLQEAAAALLGQLMHVVIACLTVTAAVTNQLLKTSHEYHEWQTQQGITHDCANHVTLCVTTAHASASHTWGPSQHSSQDASP